MSVIGERAILKIVERLVREGLVPDDPALRREAQRAAWDATRRRVRQLVREQVEGWLGLPRPPTEGLRKTAG